MTTRFTHGEIGLIRQWRRRHGKVKNLCGAFAHVHTRDELVEAIWATVRFENDWDAMRHVNQVLAYQDCGMPMVNGRPLARGHGQELRPAAMF